MDAIIELSNMIFNAINGITGSIVTTILLITISVLLVALALHVDVRIASTVASISGLAGLVIFGVFNTALGLLFSIVLVFIIWFALKSIIQIQ